MSQPTTSETPLASPNQEQHQSCDSCGAVGSFVSEFGQTGLIQFCSKCNFRPQAKPKAAPPVARKDAPTPVRVVAPSGDLVEQVRARLAALDVDIERLDAMKRERSTLRRMLRAAEAKR